MKIQIRKTILADSRDLHRNINDSDVIKELSGYPFPCPLNRIKKDITKSAKDWKTKKAYAFTILVDNLIVGQIFLENPSKDFGRYEIGFFIGKKHWGKGIATEAIKLTTKYGFTELNLYKIYADNDSDNPASGKALKKAGYKLEGVLKKHSRKNGKFIDIHIWGKTK